MTIVEWPTGSDQWGSTRLNKGAGRQELSIRGSDILPSAEGWCGMATSWRSTTMREAVAFFGSGDPFLKLEYSTAGVPVLAKGDVKQFGRIEHGGDRFMSEGLVNERGYRKTEPGDYLLTTRDLTQAAEFLGLLSPVPDHTRYLVNQGANVVRFHPEFDGRFLVYWCNGPIYRSYMKGHHVGSTQIHIRKEDFLDAPLLAPTLREQRAIAEVLGALDDKIEVNHKTARVLEGIARAVFTSWFVDFDPVRRRRAAPGSGPAVPLPADLAALFPKRFVDSAIGEVPEGWRVTNAGELAEFVLGGDWGKDSASEETPETAYCIRGADIPSLQAGGTGAMPLRYLKPSSLEKRSLREGDIVVEISGGSPTQSTGRPVLVNNALLEQLDHPLVCSNFCRIFRPKRHMSTYTYLWLRWLYGTDMLLQYENGTTGIKNFAFTIFCERHHVLVPPEDVLAAFAKIVDPMFAAIGRRGAQSAALVALRDALLPKLISGKLRIPDAEKLVERSLDA